MATDLAKWAKDKGVKYFMISYTDLFGSQRAKLVPTQAIADMSVEGAGFAGFATWLDLTPAQGDSITAVLDRWRPQMDSAWAEVRPRIETVRAKIRSDIAAQLTVEQQAKYEELMKRHREPPKGPPPPPRN